ncbi:MAG: phosphoribosylaminoimidazolesuccinocarboxamide synthase [Candidatus Sumerlaeia bacterium]|nr:phosphoribosylaminoimidazolesuccinocarboxamide synthase [Candidatus Sumerlaeia bacterium]
MADGLMKSNLEGFPCHRGKVRDVFDLGENLLIVATDRLSAFDVVFPDPIPGKGQVLTRLSVWWFGQTAKLVPNHLISTDVEDYPAAVQRWRGELEGRSMLVRKTSPLAAEFIVRGYLDGSAWKQYQKDGEVCGVKLPAGLPHRAAFDEPILTPTTKADVGHDAPIDFEELAKLVGRSEAETCRKYSIVLYSHAHQFVRPRGLVLSDTKFEFGKLPSGEVILIDEALTPDSSRYWLADTYYPDATTPISLDKQYVRDFADQLGWSKTPPAPRLPPEVIEQTMARYRKAYERVTGEAWKD